MKPRHWKSFADQDADPKGAMTNGMSNGLIIQGYCLGVTEQPSFDFSGDPNLKTLQDQCNSTMKVAVDNANNYINTMQPDCLTTIDNMLHFIRLQNTRIDSYKNGDLTKQDLANELNEVISRGQSYQKTSVDLMNDFNTLRPKLATDSGNFKDLAAKVTAAITGDGGAVATLQQEVANLDTKIKELTASSVLGALAIVGGSILIGVGAATDVFTGGAATAAVVVGVGIVGAGIGTDVGSALGLAAAIKQKNQYLTEIHLYKAEATQANAVASHLGLLDAHAEDAVYALQKVAACWKTVGDSLGALVEDLNEDLSDDDLESLIEDYQADIKDLSARVQTIQDQFTGCSQPVNKSEAVDQLITDWANGLQKAA